MPKYTPGPWEWVIENGDIEIRMGDAVESPYSHSSHNCFKYVDMIGVYKEEQKEQVIANADLMVAAPKLLEAAEYVIMKNDEIEMTGFRELLEAVKKAKGENNNE